MSGRRLGGLVMWEANETVIVCCEAGVCQTGVVSWGVLAMPFKDVVCVYVRPTG